MPTGGGVARTAIGVATVPGVGVTVGEAAGAAPNEPNRAQAETVLETRSRQIRRIVFGIDGGLVEGGHVRLCHQYITT